MKALEGDKKMRFARLGVLAVAAVLVIGSAPAFAVPVVTLFDGATTVTVADNGVGDLNLAPGAVTFVGPVGSWILNVSTGITFPSAFPPYPNMDLNSVNQFSGLGLNTMTVRFTDDSSLPPSLTGWLSLDIGGTLGPGMSLIYNAYVNGGLFATVGPFSRPPSAFSGTALGFVDVVGPYTLTQEIIISGTPGIGANTSFDGALTAGVPEPGTMLLLGSGLAALWARRRRI
jgi:hypothetical protein